MNKSIRDYQKALFQYELDSLRVHPSLYNTLVIAQAALKTAHLKKTKNLTLILIDPTILEDKRQY